MIFKTGPLRLEEWTSDSRSEWTSYWCVLTANDKDSLVLNFYDRQGDDAPSHSLALLSCDVRSKYDLLTVTSTVRVSFLNAASVAEAEEWVRKIKGAADGGFWARLQKSVSSASPVVRLSPAERAQRHAAQLDHFNECFVRATDAALREKAVSGGLANSLVRSVVWKLFLGAIASDVPTSQWPDEIRAKRDDYHELRRRFHPNFLAHDVAEQLRQAAMNSTLEREIRKDLNRTQGNDKFFREPAVQATLMRILVVYARENEEIGYKQGMNEILAIVFKLLHHEKIDRPEEAGDRAGGGGFSGGVGNGEKSTRSNAGAPPGSSAASPDMAAGSDQLPLPEKTGGEMAATVAVLLDGACVEHDAFILLSLIMARMRGMYAPEDEPGSEQLPGHSERRSWLLRKMVRIQDKKLRHVQSSLTEQLERLDVEAHMYMLPWLRLLFSREYTPEGVWLVWDALFAETPADFELVDFVAVSVLWHLREPLLECDSLPDALKLLCHRTKHVECAPVLSVIKQARVFRRSSAFYSYSAEGSSAIDVALLPRTPEESYDERASVEIAAPAPAPPPLLAAAADPPPAEEVVADEDATVPDDRWNPYT